MLISAWLVASLDDTVVRWRGQVVGLVPTEALTDRLPNGNSILWATFHVARHADLALEVLGADRADSAAALAALPAEAGTAGAGLQEVQQPWFADVPTSAVEEYAEVVFAAVRLHLAATPDDGFVASLDIRAALLGAGVDESAFSWLYGQWSEGGPELLTRWPLTAHITHHVGEMVATRNQLGLSPFR